MIECECKSALDKKVFKCMDCAMCTLCNDEYYMVQNELWSEAIPEKHGMICIGCIEQRLGRLLTKDDFTDAPLNSMNLVMGSTRLRNRLTQIAASATI